MRLDFNFPAQLVFQSFLLYLGLEEDFQGHNEMAFLEASQVHIPKFSLARGRLISKSIVKRRLKEKSLNLGGGWRVRDPSCSPVFFRFCLPGPLFLLKGPSQGVWSTTVSPVRQHLTRAACSSSLGPTSLPLPDSKQRHSHDRGAGPCLTCCSY